MGKITQDDLMAVLHYNPETGIFTRLARAGKHAPGSIAGTIDDDGYVRITIAGNKYRAQRLAFLYMTGSFPSGEVDHEDRVRTNNAWANLREATTQQNAANRGTTAKSGYKGVEQTKTGYVARIKYNGVRQYLGTFPTADGAHAAYVSAANDLYGEFARAA
ncbi:hypothetical protein G6N76_09680 [Rhizobium daejeonense]|uniref:AP2/ERF domain-containing protein n=1 Tax=Rhizobium daejeonense TaxID=240521 RepID=A0A6M1RYY1_9HYPH|nr:HNH endonuclease [Rhizobium daejeonense]NGO63943.1 hypothetical protein [Rhizobium daejeonense]